ncbi:hypothetical protein A2642_03585 [Candidatus Nomurabacteria bacterium RIFCSPHIGHO2_01_FULL_39_10]|uniref:Uncharacterized protein n=1 Tax=Candidatus Nomurabacteria bacterium RIFCSPHIGHO2_01_FULL_39_10 TaxID=1801733 RepID=A0A1F6V5G7_9BACT|nr:MAG: hypothetical protein A2642_03585 [Candidatus Nomurabacteria bacterium RIFCSPHIGHO2_01_FULL_39_10]
MKNLIKVLVFLAILGVVWYQFGGAILSRFLSCKNPIVYTLGAFDTKFGISQKYFLSALADAEAIWEKPFGKELFAYKTDEKSDDSLKINLVYDYRQEATSKLASLGIVVEDSRDSYESLKSKLTVLKTEYEKAKNAFDGQVKIFNQKQLAYEEEVMSWNKKRGGLRKINTTSLNRNVWR